MRVNKILLPTLPHTRYFFIISVSILKNKTNNYEQSKKRRPREGALQR